MSLAAPRVNSTAQDERLNTATTLLVSALRLEQTKEVRHSMKKDYIIYSLLAEDDSVHRLAAVTIAMILEPYVEHQSLICTACGDAFTTFQTVKHHQRKAFRRYRVLQLCPWHMRPSGRQARSEAREAVAHRCAMHLQQNLLLMMGTLGEKGAGFTTWIVQGTTQSHTCQCC